MVARILSMARHKSFRGGSTLHITSQLLKEAEDLVVKDVQKELKDEIEKTDQKGRKGGRYASLNPGKDEHGYYVVGQRLKNNNPMTPDALLQKLLPTHHPVTRLFMECAHKQCVHRGWDSTLARFRQKYWTAQGRSTAKNPGEWQPFTYSQSPKTRYSLVQTAVEDFWEKWIQLYAPSLVVRRKWHFNTRNLRPGDVVMIADKNLMRGEYRLRVVKEVFPYQDGKVRRVLVTYKNFRVGNHRQDYGISEAVTVSRSIQHLALLVPVETEDGDKETTFWFLVLIHYSVLPHKRLNNSTIFVKK
jgi:hypothetical protein